MGQIATTWTDAVGSASKTYTIADADMAKCITAYQSGANSAVNGTATRAQVLNYMFDLIIKAELQNTVQANQTTPPVIPPPITIT